MHYYKSKLVWDFILLVSLVRADSSFPNNPIIPIFAKALTLAENTALGKSWWNTKKTHDYVQPGSLSHLFFNLKPQWQEGASENTLNIHVPELGHTGRILLILTLASSEAPRSGLVTASSPQFWGVSWRGRVPLLGWMWCLCCPWKQGGGQRHCPSPATQTRARAGWAITDLPNDTKAAYSQYIVLGDNTQLMALLPLPCGFCPLP